MSETIFGRGGHTGKVSVWAGGKSEIWCSDFEQPAVVDSISAMILDEDLGFPFQQAKHLNSLGCRRKAHDWRKEFIRRCGAFIRQRKKIKKWLNFSRS